MNIMPAAPAAAAKAVAPSGQSPHDGADHVTSNSNAAETTELRTARPAAPCHEAPDGAADDLGSRPEAAAAPVDNADAGDGEGSYSGESNDEADGTKGPSYRKASRRPHLQGRFSGRLATKADEKTLADECRLLGPLIGGTGKRGDRSLLTLAKIVRGIASGEVRQYVEELHLKLQLAKQKLAAWESAGGVGGQALGAARLELAALWQEMETRGRGVHELERQLGLPPSVPHDTLAHSSVASATAPQAIAALQLQQQQQQQQQQQLGQLASLQLVQAAAAAAAGSRTGSTQLPAGFMLDGMQLQAVAVPGAAQAPHLQGQQLLVHPNVGGGQMTTLWVNGASPAAMVAAPQPEQPSTGAQSLVSGLLLAQGNGAAAAAAAAAQGIQVVPLQQHAQAGSSLFAGQALAHAHNHLQASAQAQSLHATAHAINQAQAQTEGQLGALKAQVQQLQLLQVQVPEAAQAEARKLQEQVHVQAAAAAEVTAAAKRAEAQAQAYAVAHAHATVAQAQAQEMCQQAAAVNLTGAAATAAAPAADDEPKVGAKRARLQDDPHTTTTTTMTMMTSISAPPPPAASEPLQPLASAAAPASLAAAGEAAKHVAPASAAAPAMMTGSSVLPLAGSRPVLQVGSLPAGADGASPLAGLPALSAPQGISVLPVGSSFLSLGAALPAGLSHAKGEPHVLQLVDASSLAPGVTALQLHPGPSGGLYLGNFGPGGVLDAQTATALQLQALPQLHTLTPQQAQPNAAAAAAAPLMARPALPQMAQLAQYIQQQSAVSAKPHVTGGAGGGGG